MMHFVTTLGHYMLTCVIDRLWQQMVSAMGQATSVDDMVQIHSTFLQQCLLQCLASPDTTMHATKDKVLTYCVIFADNIQKFIASIEPTAGKCIHHDLRPYIDRYMHMHMLYHIGQHTLLCLFYYTIHAHVIVTSSRYLLSLPLR